MSETKERIVKSIKENNRLNYVSLHDLAHFIKKHIDSNFKISSAKKSDVLKIAEEYLSEETLDIFFELNSFGLLKKDLNYALNASDKTVQELIDSKQLSLLCVKNIGSGSFTVNACIYSIPDMLSLEEKGLIKHKKARVSHCREFEPTDENLAEALYVINKSAKVSRDTKNNSYIDGRHGVCHAAKTRMNDIYELKDTVLRKLISENRIEYIGFNKQTNCDMILKLYRLDSFTFHKPITFYDKTDPELADKYKLDDIEGLISSEKTKDTDIKFQEAIKLLKSYSTK